MPLSLDTLSGAAAALILVLGLILAAGRGLKALNLRRVPRLGGDRRLGIRETLSLDQARRLHIIRCDGRDLLLLTGGSGDLMVGWIGEATIAQGSAGS